MTNQKTTYTATVTSKDGCVLYQGLARDFIKTYPKAIKELQALCNQRIQNLKSFEEKNQELRQSNMRKG